LLIVECYYSPPLTRLLLIAGILIVSSIPASARTDCSEVREEKGEGYYYLWCKAENENEENQEAIDNKKENIKREREDMEDFYEDLIDRLEDLKRDTEKRMRREQEDEEDRLDDLKDDEASETSIAKQEIKIHEFKEEKNVTNWYIEKWIEVVKAQLNMEHKKLDLNEVEFELKQRGGSTSIVQWY